MRAAMAAFAGQRRRGAATYAAWTRAGNEVSGRRAEAVVDRGDINNVRRGPVVGPPPTAVAERHGPSSGRATMSTTRSGVRPPIRRGPDARIIDVSSSRTSTVPEVLLNAWRRPALDHPPA